MMNSDEKREFYFRCGPRSPVEVEFARRAMGDKLTAMGCSLIHRVPSVNGKV